MVSSARQVSTKWLSSPTAAVSGVTYTRWGRTSCPNDTEAQLVYSGRAGGTNYNARGGSAEKICLPDDPDYIPGSIDLSPSPAQAIKGVVQGAELQVNYGVPGNPLQHLHNHNVPCAVCFVPVRSTTIMVPAKTVCPVSWTREYYGYLMTESDNNYRSSYTCLDVNPESVTGEGSNTNPSFLYHTVTDCNGLSCPPYENNHQLSCVVCTKWSNTYKYDYVLSTLTVFVWTIVLDQLQFLAYIEHKLNPTDVCLDCSRVLHYILRNTICHICLNRSWLRIKAGPVLKPGSEANKRRIPAVGIAVQRKISITKGRGQSSMR